MLEEKRKGVDSLTGYMDFGNMALDKKLNGTKPRMRYEDVQLPTWLQTQPI
jgi:hypothetical protein